MHLSFLGASRTVTGSKFLLETGTRRILFDCGLFQGLKELRLRNWSQLPVRPADIDAVVLTHVHLDHSGYLPLLVKNGFHGPVWCTPGTADLCAILLPDSGYLQEEEAARANRKGYSKHKPALPLYTRADAVIALDRLETVPFGMDFDLGDGLRARFHHAGHILGAASITVTGKRWAVPSSCCTTTPSGCSRNGRRSFPITSSACRSTDPMHTEVTDSAGGGVARGTAQFAGPVGGEPQPARRTRSFSFG